MVHIVSILNLTRYKTQVNRQWINIILKELMKSNEDIRALFNITNQLATQVQMMELMGEVLQETLSSDKPFWLRPSFLMGCIGFVASIMSTVACITKKKVAAWKPPALTGFLPLCRKDKNNTKMDDEDMDGPIYRPSGIIPTVIRPQESHGLCVIPQPA